LDKWPGIVVSFVDEVVVWKRLERFIDNLNCGEKGVADSLLEAKSDFGSQTLPEWRGLKGKGFEESQTILPE
jgi:hypothetical protein